MGPLGRSRRVGRRRGLVAGAVIGSSMARRGQRQAEATMNEQIGQDSQTSNANKDQQLSELEQLGDLKDKGVLTEEEFEMKKREILGL